jgi:hypothetical protein
MSDARLISRISVFFTPEALDDVGEGRDRDEYADRKRIARQVIAIVRKADKRRKKRLRARRRK